MNDDEIPKVDFRFAKLLAEVVRLQRWAGGDSIAADRIFGLLHGFESVYRQETEGFGISEEIQDKVEDILEEVEAGTQATDGMSIKGRLYEDGIDETVASNVMELCRLQSRFFDGVEAIINGEGSEFSYLAERRNPEQNWFGALHYMELYDCTEGERTKMHAVFAPAIPRVGEIVSPQRGSQMVVVGVEHVVMQIGQSEGISQPILVPYILLEIHEPEQGVEAV